jgi:toxin ParE1/3/4
MTCEVSLTKGAERGLEEIYFYIAEHDSPASADHVLDRLIRATDALKTTPDPGSYVDEWRPLGISEYRQVFFKPWRLHPSELRIWGIVRTASRGRWLFRQAQEL